MALVNIDARLFLHEQQSTPQEQLVDYHHSGAGHNIHSHPKTSTIHTTLPLETMTEIFKVYVQDSYRSKGYRCPSKGALPLGGVCQVWRNIAWSNPCLWTTLEVKFEPTKVTEGLIQLAIEWLSRSGASVPLTILLRAHESSERLFLPLIDVINQSMNRCHSLNLDMPTSLLNRFSNASGVSTLRNLSLRGGGRNSSCLFYLGLKMSPNMLNIAHIQLRSLVIDFTSLTKFVATGMLVDELLDVFRLAPQLETCYPELLNRETDSPLPIKAYRSSVTLLQLKDLELEMQCDKEKTTIFMEKATLPNLKYMACRYIDCGSDFPSAAFARFLARAPLLTMLILFQVVVTSEELIQIAQAAPSITQFTLCAVTAEQPSLERFYNALCVDHTGRNIIPGEQVLLPLLKSLNLSVAHDFPWKYLPRYKYHWIYEDGEGYDGRPWLEDIHIKCNCVEPELDEMMDEVQSDMEPRALIGDWETFSDLMDLREEIGLDLNVENPRTRIMTDLFDVSFQHLEATVGKASKYNRESQMMWTSHSDTL